MRMHTSGALAALLFAALSSSAHADVGIGLFVGEPVGLDLKIDLSNRTALDIVLGANTFREGNTDYGHLTYLVTPVAGRGSSVIIPLRIGIGAALIGAVDGDAVLAVRAPLELGFKFRRTPLEIYAEVAAVLDLVGRPSSPDFHLDGGVGVRIYF